MLGLGQTDIYDPPVDINAGGIYDYPIDRNAGTNWWDVINRGLTSATGILTARYAVPQLNQGQYIQSGPYGTIMSQGNPNTQFAMPSLSAMGSSGTLLLLGGGALLLFMMSRGH